MGIEVCEEENGEISQPNWLMMMPGGWEERSETHNCLLSVRQMLRILAWYEFFCDYEAGKGAGKECKCQMEGFNRLTSVLGECLNTALADCGCV